MKMSVRQVIGITILLALSLIYVGTHVEQADAHPYTLIVYHYDVYY